VGYVGRDVESMIRDLTELSVNMLKKEEHERVKEKATLAAEERILDILMPKRRSIASGEAEEISDQSAGKIRARFKSGSMNDRVVELDVPDRAFPS